MKRRLLASDRSTCSESASRQPVKIGDPDRKARRKEMKECRRENEKTKSRSMPRRKGFDSWFCSKGVSPQHGSVGFHHFFLWGFYWVERLHTNYRVLRGFPLSKVHCGISRVRASQDQLCSEDWLVHCGSGKPSNWRVAHFWLQNEARCQASGLWTEFGVQTFQDMRLINVKRKCERNCEIRLLQSH